MVSVNTLPVRYGGTGAVTAAGAREGLQLTELLGRDDLNIIHNPVMRVAQRGTSIASAPGGYSLDRWALTYSMGGAVTISQDTDVPAILTETPYEIPFSYKVDVTTADASVAAGDYFGIYQGVEGYWWKKLARQPMLLSFWAKTSRSGGGNLTANFRVNGSPTAYNWLHDCSLTSSWQRFVIPIDASGSWGEANTISPGAYLYFWMMTGSTYTSSTVDEWVSGNILGSTNVTNFLDSTANDVWITDVRLTPALYDLHTVPPRSYMDDYILCRRYFRKFQSQGSGAYDAMTLGGSAYTNQAFVTQDLSNMRATGGTLSAVNPTQMYIHAPGYTNVVCTNVYGQSWAGTVGVWGAQYTASIGSPVSWACWLTGQGGYTTCYLTASCEI